MDIDFQVGYQSIFFTSLIHSYNFNINTANNLKHFFNSNVTLVDYYVQNVMLSLNSVNFNLFRMKSCFTLIRWNVYLILILSVHRANMSRILMKLSPLLQIQFMRKIVEKNIGLFQTRGLLSVTFRRRV